MKILQTVIVKQVLTEKSKAEIENKYQQQKLQIQKEAGQLQFELKKFERTKKHSHDSLRKHFEKEVQVRQEKIKLIDFQLEQLHMLPLGSELQESECQAVIEINEGDAWDNVVAKTIIIKDGIVKEIR